MASAKEIQTRIKSVSNTKKITKAMEMVAAAKMRRAIEAVLATREYANLTWNTIINISKNAKSENDSHPLLLPRKEIKNVLFVLVASNRGLCGGFNNNVINLVNSYAKKNFTNGEKIEVLSLGKKGISVRSRFGFNVVAQFDKPDTSPKVEDVRPIAKIVTDDYLAGKYDKVILVYTDFVSGTVQEARAKQILPVDVKAEEDHLGQIEGEVDEKNSRKVLESVFTFEPNVEEVLDNMVPRLLEVQLYQALLESNSSEHSARMMAMHQATDAATDMMAELTLSYNKARQASITNEISEIVAGANALS